MKLKMLQRILTLGLILKVAALLLAVVVSGPELTYGPAVVAAQEAEKTEEAAKAEEGGGEAKEGEAKEEPPSQAPQYDPRLIELLEKKQQSLALEEERIQRERQELGKPAQRTSITESSSLKKVQAALDDMIDKQNKQRQERITQLVKVLSNMRPEPAAEVIAKLEINMAVEVFRRMQSRDGGQGHGPPSSPTRRPGSAHSADSSRKKRPMQPRWPRKRPRRRVNSHANY